MIVAIGNAPSSGSTYLADLLDSLPFAVCGPELHLFSPRGHYRRFRARYGRGFGRSPSPACYATFGDRFGDWALGDYGFDRDAVAALRRESADFANFCDRFLGRYAKHRGKSATLFFEKTPENIHGAAAFLDTFPRSMFVHIVRDPLPVYRSLRRRGFGFYLATSAWLVDVSAAWALREHPRFVTVRYEDLVGDPPAEIERLLSRLDHSLAGLDIAQLYRENTYRAERRRLDTWRYSGYGTMGDANEAAAADEDRAALAFMAGLSTNPAYAAHFDLPVVTLRELAEHYGYEMRSPGGPQTWSALAPQSGRDRHSHRRLAVKWANDFVRGGAAFGDAAGYMRPTLWDGS